jgi:hypothetical protein
LTKAEAPLKGGTAAAGNEPKSVWWVTRPEERTRCPPLAPGPAHINCCRKYKGVNEMELFCNWTIENYLNLLSIILVSGGGILALIQWEFSKKLKRAEFIDQILNKILFDKDI